MALPIQGTFNQALFSTAGLSMLGAQKFGKAGQGKQTGGQPKAYSAPTMETYVSQQSLAQRDRANTLSHLSKQVTQDIYSRTPEQLKQQGEKSEFLQMLAQVRADIEKKKGGVSK